MAIKNEDHPPFTQSQIDIIEKELANRNFSFSSQDIEICELAEHLQQKHFNQKSSLDIAVFLRTRINNIQRQQPSILQIPSIPADSRASMFRQFAQIKQENNSSKQYICKSKRKIRPTEPVERKTLDQTVQALDSSISECQAIFERKGRKGIINQTNFNIHQSCLWAFHEQFYSSLDKYYLHDDQLFSRLIAELGMVAQRMTYAEHRMLRRALPVPRLFGPLKDLRIYEHNYDLLPDMYGCCVQKGKELELSVGKEVIAIHPVCGHLHSACILAIYKENQFMVKFTRPELGTQKVLDILMAPKEISSPHRVVIENIDFEVMALAIRLLQYKADLLKLMKEYNITAEAIQRSQGALDNVFFQEYGWIGSTINILSLGIKHVVSKFRIRGLSSANQQKIGKHFSSILINPLSLMQKQLDKSSQNSDVYASKQIKNIMNTHKQSRSEHYVKELFTKCITGLKNCSLQSDQREEMERIMKAMIGLLVNLRYESRSFSIEDNRYLNELMTLIDGRYPEHVNQIYQTLHSITSKIGGEVK